MKCIVCGEEFMVLGKVGKTCSPRCANKAWKFKNGMVKSLEYSNTKERSIIQVLEKLDEAEFVRKAVINIWKKSSDYEKQKIQALNTDIDFGSV